MTMQQLPLDVIQEILLRLPPMDRIDKALIDRRWAQACSSSRVLEGVWFHTNDARMRRIGKIRRHYRNLRLFGAHLRRPCLRTKVGGNVRRLQLISCKFTPDDLYILLQQCTKLEWLYIYGYSGQTSPEDVLKPSNRICLDTVRESLRNVQCFRTDLSLSQETIDLLLDLMPNIDALHLEVPPYYNAQSPNRYTLRTNLMLTRLAVEAALFREENLIHMINTYAGSLEGLHLYGEFDLTDAMQSAIGDCTKLSELYVWPSNEFSESYLAKLVRNSPDLFILCLPCIHPLTDACLEHICGLTKLEFLRFNFDQISTSAQRGLGKLGALKYLDSAGDRDTVAGVLESISCLEGLESLYFSHKVTSDDFDIICRNFGRLKRLGIDCERLTSADITKIRFLKDLKDLRLRNCQNFTDVAFKEGVGSLSLECLNIQDWEVTDVGFASLNARGGRLKQLDLLRCSRLSGAGLLAVLRREPFLRMLRLDRCDRLEDGWAAGLRTICPRLEVLKCDLSKREAELLRRHKPSVLFNTSH